MSTNAIRNDSDAWATSRPKKNVRRLDDASSLSNAHSCLRFFFRNDDRGERPHTTWVDNPPSHCLSSKKKLISATPLGGRRTVVGPNLKC